MEGGLDFKQAQTMLTKAKWRSTRRPSDQADVPRTPPTTNEAEFLQTSPGSGLGMVHGTPTIPLMSSPVHTRAVSARIQDSLREMQIKRNRTRSSGIEPDGRHSHHMASAHRRSSSLTLTDGEAGAVRAIVGQTESSSIISLLAQPPAANVHRSTSLGSYDRIASGAQHSAVPVAAPPRRHHRSSSLDYSQIPIEAADVNAALSSSHGNGADALSFEPQPPCDPLVPRPPRPGSAHRPTSAHRPPSAPRPSSAQRPGSAQRSYTEQRPGSAQRSVSDHRPSSSASRPSSASGRREGLWVDVRVQTPTSSRGSPTTMRRASQIASISPRPGRSGAVTAGSSVVSGSPPRTDVLVVEDADSDEGPDEPRDDSDEGEPIPDPFDVDFAASPDVYPLTLRQQALISRPSTVVKALRFAGAIDHNLLEQSLTALIDAHAVLRTRIESGIGRALGRVCAAGSFALSVEDGDEDSVGAVVAREQSLPIDCAASEPVLLRVTLVHVRKELNFIVLAVPGALCDAWSASLLVCQLTMMLNGEAAPTEEAAVSFAQLALREARVLSGGDGVLASLRHFWSSRADCPLLQPPRGDGDETATRTAFRVSRSNIVAFTELLILPSHCRVDAADITMMMCLTSWLIALQQSVGVADFVVGLAVSLRDLHPTGVRSLVAPLSGVYPLRIRMSRATSFADVFMDVVRSVYLTRTHAQYPVQPPASAGAYPVQFEYFRQHDTKLLTTPAYLGDLHFSDTPEVPPPTRSLPSALAPDCTVRVRMWESPDSCRRVWGDVTVCDVAMSVPAVLDIVKYVVKEAACEAHVTLAKLSSRIAHRSARPGSAR
eukprot:m.95916 g.95916  ORF g.95916 m.95916 type:complete len:829 (-) comp8614_c0_seq2:391-2877(-)